ncbi:hypothetical protein M8J75_010490 [Diaphorina citri]|nr:hypothetical protein M8J75_010490 [Diaphorina citri]
MEWVNLNPMILSTFGSLRVHEDETNITENDRVEVLQDIYNKLCFEDRTTRPFRRAIGFTQVVKKDLLPLLISTKDDSTTILMNLTIPVECLLPIDSLCKTDEGRNTIYELNWLLTSCKEAFLESKITRCIIEHIKKFTDNESETHVTARICDCINNCLVLLRNILHIPVIYLVSRRPMSLSGYETHVTARICDSINNCLVLLRNILHIPVIYFVSRRPMSLPGYETHVTARICDCINNCLVLLRNILHIPEVRGGVTTSHHNQILWNLFTHGFDKVLTQLISQHHRHKLWSISVVQLIALMYKDQHVNTLQKLLNLWFETSPSEEDSSEDNESNTSPPVSR